MNLDRAWHHSDSPAASPWFSSWELRLQMVAMEEGARKRPRGQGGWLLWSNHDPPHYPVQALLEFSQMTVLKATGNSQASSLISFYKTHRALSPNPCFFPSKLLHTSQCPGSLTLPRTAWVSPLGNHLKLTCRVLPLSHTGLHSCRAAGLQPPPPDHRGIAQGLAPHLLCSWRPGTLWE